MCVYTSPSYVLSIRKQTPPFVRAPDTFILILYRKVRMRWIVLIHVQCTSRYIVHRGHCCCDVALLITTIRALGLQIWLYGVRTFDQLVRTLVVISGPRLLHILVSKETRPQSVIITIIILQITCSINVQLDLDDVCECYVTSECSIQMGNHTNN